MDSRTIQVPAVAFPFGILSAKLSACIADPRICAPWEIDFTGREIDHGNFSTPMEEIPMTRWARVLSLLAGLVLCPAVSLALPSHT
jgi:hypothetical protein